MTFPGIRGGLSINTPSKSKPIRIILFLSINLIYFYEINKARISLMEKNIRINNCKNIKLFEKRARTLDSIFEENKIRKCNFLKIDCEGCEYEIFKNTSPKYLSRIEFIALEAHTFNKKMVTEYKNLILMLKQNKFKTREEVNPVHSHIKLLF